VILDDLPAFRDNVGIAVVVVAAQALDRRQPAIDLGAFVDRLAVVTMGAVRPVTGVSAPATQAMTPVPTTMSAAVEPAPTMRPAMQTGSTMQSVTAVAAEVAEADPVAAPMKTEPRAVATVAEAQRMPTTEMATVVAAAVVPRGMVLRRGRYRQ